MILRAIDIIREITAIPYGRASDRRGETILRERRGTCSGKHYLLRDRLGVLGIEVQLIHRVYRLTREDALRRFSSDVAATIPEAGLTDVHTYAVVMLAGTPTQIDVTFPHSWDGVSPMSLSCGPGTDVPVPRDADAHALKEDLVRTHCDSALREPFIAALARL
jgi:hypothetical protein